VNMALIHPRCERHEGLEPSMSGWKPDALATSPMTRKVVVTGPYPDLQPA
jgi:hypothetical protein